MLQIHVRGSDALNAPFWASSFVEALRTGANGCRRMAMLVIVGFASLGARSRQITPEPCSVDHCTMVSVKRPWGSKVSF